MWIPYDITGSLKPGNPAADALSRADTAPRDFLIGFLLRNPVTQAWELDVLAGADASVTEGSDLHLTFSGNEAGKLAEIMVRLTARSAEDAIERAYRAVSRRLLRYVVETGRGMAVAGWRVADPTHDARWRCTPFRPSALMLDHAALTPVGSDLAPLVELFQRARNAPDPATRMLAAFAVLHAAASGHAALAQADTDGFRVTSAMLAHAGALDETGALAGQDLAALIAALRPHHDALIGPAGTLTPLPETLAARQSLGRMANLADLAAHRLLAAELAARRASAAEAEPATVAAQDGLAVPAAPHAPTHAPTHVPTHVPTGVAALRAAAENIRGAAAPSGAQP